MAACGLRIVVLLLLSVSLCCSQNAGQSSVVTDIRLGGQGEQDGQEDGQGTLWHMIAAYREGSTELPSTTAPPNPTTQQFGAIPPVPDPEDAECFVTKVQSQAGLCGQFNSRNGRGQFYCQSGEYILIQPECGAIVRARTARAAARGNPEARTPREQN